VNFGSLARFAAVHRLRYSVDVFVGSEGFSEQLQAVIKGEYTIWS